MNNCVMYYICFADSHSFWCDFWWLSLALSFEPAKFAFVVHEGEKWQETGENKDSFFVMNLHFVLCMIIHNLVCSFSL